MVLVINSHFYFSTNLNSCENILELNSLFLGVPLRVGLRLPLFGLAEKRQPKRAPPLPSRKPLKDAIFFEDDSFSKDILPWSILDWKTPIITNYTYETKKEPVDKGFAIVIVPQPQQNIAVCPAERRHHKWDKQNALRRLSRHKISRFVFETTICPENQQIMCNE